MLKKWFVISAIIALLFTSACAMAPNRGEAPGKQGAAPGETAKVDPETEAIYMDSCAGCHGQTRLGGLGPNLLPERLFEGMSEENVFDVIKDGRVGTPMPPFDTISKGKADDETIHELVEYLKTPVSKDLLKWTLDDAEKSLVVVNEEETLPDKPTAWDDSQIDLDDIMIAMERETRKYAVMDGKNHKLLGHIDGSYRTHTVQFGPKGTKEARYMYGIGRDGWLFKVDLYSFKTVRKVRVGLDSRGIAVSKDGEYIAVTNYLPGSVAIVNDDLEPLKIIDTIGVDPDGNEVHSRAAAILDSEVKHPEAGQIFVVALKEAGHVWGIDVSKKGEKNDFPIIFDIPNVGRILHDAFFDDEGRYFMVAAQGDKTKPSLLDPSKPDNGLMAVIDVVEGKMVSQLSAGVKPHPGPGAVVHTKNHGVLYATPAIGENKVTFWKQTEKGFEVYKQVSLGKPGENGGSLFIRSYNGVEGLGKASNYVWVDISFAPNWNKVYLIDKEKLEVYKDIDNAAYAKMDPAKVRSVHPEFTKDGKFVYVALWEGNAVQVFTDDGKFVTQITGTTTPTGIFNYGVRQHEPGL